MRERFLPGGADVEDADGVREHAVGDVIFEALQVAAANTGSDLRTGAWKAANMRFPVFVFVEEGVPEFRFSVQITGGSDQLRLGQPLEGDSHRNANRAFFKTSDDDTPSSPSMSICSARSELTVASSICSKRE